jgi:hypothetical protein
MTPHHKIQHAAWHNALYWALEVEFVEQKEEYPRSREGKEHLDCMSNY